MIEIDKLTIGEIKQITNLFNQKAEAFPYKIGDKVFIRTVTLYYLGRINNIIGEWIILDGASWIADTGRFYDFLKDGKCNEYESFIDHVCVPMGSVIDITEWKHDLFKGQK